VEDVAPLRENVVRCECPVVGFELYAHLELVQVAPWLQTGVDLRV
jgi:hypothetical protein